MCHSSHGSWGSGSSLVLRILLNFVKPTVATVDYQTRTITATVNCSVLARVQRLQILHIRAQGVHLELVDAGFESLQML